MEKRQATNISPKNQNGISYNMSGHGMVYSSEYIQNAFHAHRFPGRSCRSSSIRIGFICFIFFCHLLAVPADLSWTCGLSSSFLWSLQPLHVIIMNTGTTSQFLSLPVRWFWIGRISSVTGIRLYLCLKRNGRIIPDRKECAGVEMEWMAWLDWVGHGLSWKYREFQSAAWNTKTMQKPSSNGNWQWAR